MAAAKGRLQAAQAAQAEGGADNAEAAQQLEQTVQEVTAKLAKATEEKAAGICCLRPLGAEYESIEVIENAFCSKISRSTLSLSLSPIFCS